ncbi:MAG: PleD family two-component response regulator [Rickettsiales bacterium]|jgi:PleD family two-component response regulator
MKMNSQTVKSINRQDIVVDNTTLKNLNVIVADDQAMNLMLIAKKTSNAGANVFQCSDGEDIIKLFQWTRPNII